MKIKVYFITYNNDNELNSTLKSFLRSGITKFNYEVTVINNASDRPIQLNIPIDVKIVNNMTRPTFSTGHLSRNWNECLIDGFKDVDNPDSDIVMLCQNDVLFHTNSIEQVVNSHNKYSFISSGAGDAFHSYTVDAIKNVGLWDERFCNIGWQDCDYFLRQMIYNRSGSSINDTPHGRVHNPVNYQIVDTSKETGFDRKDINHMNSIRYHEVSMKTFIMKWGFGIPGMNWASPMTEYNGPFETALDITPDIVVKSPQWITYPFFECKIPNLKEKNYINYHFGEDWYEKKV
jgi:hypothetical protein